MNAILMLMLGAVPAEAPLPDVVLLDFTASYCAPCQQMVPVLQRLEESGFQVRKIDVSEEPELHRKYNVRKLPTLIVLAGGREVRRYQGLTPESELRRELERACRDLGEASRDQKTDRRSSRRDEAVLAEAAPPVTPSGSPSKPSLKDLISSIWQRNGGGSGFEFPKATIRGQSPSPDSDSAADSLAAAAAATVRVRVTGSKLQDVGTGTIIHSEQGMSLILTCAHLFREQDKTAVVEIDVFQNGKPIRFPVTDYSGSHRLDLALLRIRNAAPLPSVRLTDEAPGVLPEQAAFTLGCDNGRPPSVLDVKILRVNQYDGPGNITCTFDPVQGRSGGGLFDERGNLLAVCSAADRREKQGLYMSREAILTLLEEQKLEHILKPQFESTTPDVAFAEPTSARAAFDSAAGPEPTSPAFDAAEELPTSVGVVSDPTAGGAAAPFDAFSSQPASTESPAGPVESDSNEVTVLISSRTPGGPKRMIVIPQATPWLLELLTGESAGANATSVAAAVPTVRTGRKPILAVRQPENRQRP